MALSVLCGLALGLVLNLLADWLPQRILPPADPASGTSAGSARRPLRWGALWLLSIGLVWHLRSTAAVPLQLLGETGAALTYCSLLLLIATIDLEHRLVPNVLILAGLILAIGFSLLSPARGALRGHASGLTTALLGAAVGGGLFLLLALARRNALGAGDVKLALLIGMLTGFPWVLQALVLGIVLGGLAAAVLLLFRLRGPKHYIPYAPYLAAGAIATLLYGPRIGQWYATLVLRLAFLARLAGAGG